MKKVTTIAFLLISLFLGSCSSRDSSDSSITKVELVTPTLYLDESNGIVSWKKQEEASYYEYIINGKDIQITSDNQIQLEDKSSISLRAKKGNYSSNWSLPITYYNTDDVYLNYENKEITIYFYNSSFSPITLNAGEYISEPNNPTKDNYTFDGWYLDPYFQKKCDFNVPFTESTIIYSKWIPNEIINNTIFWIKADSKMSSSTFKDYFSYRVIPLNENIEAKTFSQIVNINSLKENEFASFSIMDGIQINSNRNIWND
ncbi:MAG: InlB B-repeat-containing protein, partial [Bacillales bacterium]|nr:InlB B-repeat-containing protein [Bacillales bacterium]